MSRKEAVLLVSRALAIIQLVSAFLEITTLPERLTSLHHHAGQISVLSTSAVDDYWRHYYQVSILFMLVRVVSLLLLSVIFWNCGPWMERILVPKRTDNDAVA